MADSVSTPTVTAALDRLNGMLRQLYLGAGGLIVATCALVAVELAYLRSEAIASGEKLTESYA